MKKEDFDEEPFYLMLPTITTDKFLRFEKASDDYVTVLEGQELQRLIKIYFALAKVNQFSSFQEMNEYCSVKAYTLLHPIPVPSERTRLEGIDPDLRKIDVFFNGMWKLFHMTKDLLKKPAKLSSVRNFFRQIPVEKSEVVGLLNRWDGSLW